MRHTSQGGGGTLQEGALGRGVRGDVSSGQLSARALRWPTAVNNSDGQRLWWWMGIAHGDLASLFVLGLCVGQELLLDHLPLYSVDGRARWRTRIQRLG